MLVETGPMPKSFGDCNCSGAALSSQCRASNLVLQRCPPQREDEAGARAILNDLEKFWKFDNSRYFQCLQGWIYVQKNLKLSTRKSGYSETVCPDQPENLQNCLLNFLKTVYQNFQKYKSIFFKQCRRISSTCIVLSILRRLRCVCGLKPIMPKDFSPYLPHLFGKTVYHKY